MDISKLCTFEPSSKIIEQRLKRQLQWLLLLRVCILTLLLGISVLLQSQDRELIIPPLPYIIYFIVVTYCFTIGSAIILKWIKYLKKFAFFQLLIDSLIISCLIFFSGGSLSIFSLMNFLPIIAGGILLFLTGGLAIAAFTTFGYGGLLFLEFQGYHSHFYPDFISPLSSIEIMLHHFAIPGITFFLVGILTSFLAIRLQQTEAALSQTSMDFDRLASLYKQIFDDITTGIITVNNKNEITSFNRAAEKITGFKHKEVIGIDILLKLPDLKSTKVQSLRPITDLTQKDGKTIPVGYSWTRLNMDTDCENCRIFTMQDLSEIKKMEDQVRQSEKLAAIGRMAAGIAHEFRNPLAAISGAAQVLHQELTDDPATQGLMNIIIRESDRLEHTIREFLLFSRPANPDKSLFSFSGLIHESVELLRQAGTWKQHISFEPNIPLHLDCWADPDQIKQVFLNLLNNATNGIREKKGTIFIKANETTDRAKKDYTVIEITDTGPGIPEKIRNKIFEPFFTTRENGTGLGLAIVRQIIESHGGTIELYPYEEDSGATFVITLPLP